MSATHSKNKYNCLTKHNTEINYQHTQCSNWQWNNVFTH